LVPAQRRASGSVFLAEWAARQPTGNTIRSSSITMRFRTSNEAPAKEGVLAATTACLEMWRRAVGGGKGKGEAQVVPPIFDRSDLDPELGYLCPPLMPGQFTIRHQLLLFIFLAGGYGEWQLLTQGSRHLSPDAFLRWNSVLGVAIALLPEPEFYAPARLSGWGESALHKHRPAHPLPPSGSAAASGEARLSDAP